MSDDSDAYEFDPPPELQEWLEYQREQACGHLAYTFANGKITRTSWLEACLWWSANPAARRIDQTYIGNIHISTVFLPLDHNHFNWIEKWQEEPEGVDRRPHLFETMIFGGEYNEYQWRYATLAEAKTGHWNAVDIVTGKKEME